jgi:ferredoxin
MAGDVIPVVDREICTGAGMCAVYAPGTFALDGEPRSTVIDAHGDSHGDIAAAVESCPTGALRLVPASKEDS